MMEKKKWLENGLPIDIVSGEICISTMGTGEIWIENYIRIIRLSDCFLVLQGKDYVVEVKGRDFMISYYTKDEMKIRGEIEDISFCR